MSTTHNNIDLAPDFKYVRTGEGPMDFECVRAEIDPEEERKVLEYAQNVYEDSPSMQSNQNKETIAQQKELSVSSSRKYRWVNQEELAMHPSRIGTVLTASEFITKLRDKCHLQCWYTGDPAKQFGLLALVVLGKIHGETKPVAVCGVQPGAMPEFEVLNFDQYENPTNSKYRGWRTVLLRLILGGFLTEDAVQEVFGYPSGPAGRRYRETLWGYRNRPAN